MTFKKFNRIMSASTFSIMIGYCSIGYTQEADIESDFSYNQEDYISVSIPTDVTDADGNIHKKLRRYIHSQKEKANELKAKADAKIKSIMQRARLAGTAQAKRAATQAIKKIENRLKFALLEIRKNIQQAIHRVQNIRDDMDLNVDVKRAALSDAQRDARRDAVRDMQEKQQEIRDTARDEIQAIRRVAREVGTQEARIVARQATQDLRETARAEVRVISIDARQNVRDATSG